MSTPEQLAAQYAKLNEIKAAVDAQLEAVKDQIRALGVGQWDAGPLTITVRPNRRFDTKAAAAKFDQEAYPNFWTFTLDAAKVKAALSRDDLDALMPEVGEPVVIVK